MHTGSYSEGANFKSINVKPLDLIYKLTKISFVGIAKSSTGRDTLTLSRTVGSRDFTASFDGNSRCSHRNY